MEEESSLDHISALLEDDDPRQKKAYVELTGFFNSKFQLPPSSFDDLLSHSPVMQTLADLTLNLLHTAKDSFLTQESIDRIELSIRELIQSQRQLQNQNLSSSIISRNETAEQNDLSRLRSNLIDVKSKYTSTKEKVKEQQNQILGLQNEIEELYEEKAKLNRTINQQKKDFSDELSNIKYNNNILQEKYQDALTQIKLMSGVEEGLKRQLKMAHNEADDCNERNQKISQKLKEKKDKIYKLNVQIKKLKIQFEEMAATKQFSTTQSANTSQISNNGKSSDHSEFINQKVQLEAKSRELANIQQTLKDREAVIDAQKKKIESQDNIIINNEKNMNQMKKEIDTLKDSMKQNLKKSLEDQELLSNRATELIQNRNILMKISEQLSEKYNVQKLTDIPDIVEDLLSTNLADTSANKLVSTIDGLTRFIRKYLLEDRMDSSLLFDPSQSESSSQSSIVGDRKLINQVTTIIHNIKDFISEQYGSNFEKFKLFDSLLSAREHFADDSDNCEFASLIVICAANEKLRRICIQQKKQLESFSTLFPVDRQEDTRKLFIQFDRVCQQVFKVKFEDKLSMLQFFLDNFVEFSTRMKNEVQERLMIDCDFIELPDYIMDAFQVLKEQSQENNENNDLNSSKLQASLTEAEEQLSKKDIHNKNLVKTNKKLIKEIKALRAKNSELQEKYDEIKTNQSDMEETYSSIKEKHAEIEEQERITRLEKNRLQELLDQRQENFQARVDSLIAAERNNHIDEIARLEKLWNEERQKLTAQIKSKTDKLNKQRKADKEIIDFLEKKLKTSHEIIKNSGFSPQSSPRDTRSDSSSEVSSDFLLAIQRELKRVVDVSGEWTQQKILMAIKKLVITYFKCDTKEKWRTWGLQLINGDKSSKPSEIRNTISKLFQQHQEDQKKLEMLRSEK